MGCKSTGRPPVDEEMDINKVKIGWGVFLILGMMGMAVGIVRAEEEVVIETGEASAVVESNEGVVEGCQVEVNCDGQNNNSANLTVGDSASAISGENQSVGEGVTTVVIESGEAEAIVDNENKANSNTIEVGTSEGIGVTEREVGVVENNNQAEVSDGNVAEAITGSNEVLTDNADVMVESGGATALANVINLINVNLVGSNLGIYLINNFDEEWGSLDLNGMWQKLNEGSGVQVIRSGEGGERIVIISNKNLAKLNNLVKVVAESGNNSVEGGNGVLIISGEATALANVINLININLLGSNFFIGIVNVSGENLGDIILPSPEAFKSEEGSGNGGVVENNNNSAAVNNSVKAEAESGNNEEVVTEAGKVVTGGAVALSNEVTVANLNDESLGKMWILLNVLGESTGKIYNWSYPGSVENFDEESFLFVLNGEECLSCQEGDDAFLNENQAEVNNEISVLASSGGNQIEGAKEGEIESGDARSVANLTNLVNLNVRGSRWFWGIINVLGNWKGNVIFAYPDLRVTLSADKNKGRRGEEINYQINYGNLGYEGVGEAEVQIELPSEFIYLGDDSGKEVRREGNKLVWKFNNLSERSDRFFNLKLKLGEEVEEKNQEVRVTALIQSGAKESDLSNNQSSWATIIWYPIEENKDDGREAKVEVAAKNNVNDFVLPGDTVTFQIKVKNSGEKIIKEAVLVHEIFDEKGNLWSSNQIYLGDIELDKEGLINFGIVMTEAGGKYSSRSWVVAKDENGNEVQSNVAETSFEVKRKVVLLKRGEVLAAEKETEVVADGLCLADKTFWPYLMLFVVSSLWLQKQLRIWLRKK